MGEVYRAIDTKLKRQVAIKVLPESLPADPDRLARLQREAEVLASLNHPNIAHVYGIEDTSDAKALVMELVEGPTLADRIAQGPIPIADALPIAKQIAEALEAAHEQGIIHRDLKPANIKVKADGTVKVLDFGLAKAMDATASSSANATMSPTLSMHATMAGIILGTAAYMSPEQAAGKAVDKRTDLWAFGVVLLEMLTGRPVFTGETVSHVLAAVLAKDPDWTLLPADTPAPIRRLLRRCLEKDRKRRLADAADARLDIDDALTPSETIGPAAAPSRRLTPLPIALASIGGALVVALVMWAGMHWTPVPKLQPVRFAVVPPAAQSLIISAADREFAISPDGTNLVYVAGDRSGTPRFDGQGRLLNLEGGQLMLRAINQLDAVPLRGITGASTPFISPDGRWIGFFDVGGLKKVSIAGGPSISLCPVQTVWRGASWGPDGTIVFATIDPTTGLLSVSEAGGEPKVLTKPDPTRGESDHVFPSFLPGRRAVLFTIAMTGGTSDNTQIAVLDTETGQRKTLIRGGSHAEYVAPGYLVYASAGTLRAVRFDPVKLEVLSDPVRVVEQVMTMSDGVAEFSVSRQGTLVYVPGGTGALTAPSPPRSLVWVNRQGREEPIKAPPRTYAIPRLSPDGTRVAVDIRDQNNDIWIWGLARQTLERLTKDERVDMGPVWTPDGQRIVWASVGADPPNLFWQAADGTGTPKRLTTSMNAQFPSSISPDGKRLVFFEATSGTAVPDVAMMSLDGGSSTDPEALLHTTAAELNAEISPDGHWLAYQSNESGQYEIYVRPFPTVNERRSLVSTSGGTRPAWARSGRELFYLDGKGLLTAVPVETTTSNFKPGNPTTLLNTRYYAGASALFDLRGYDVSSDGQRFLMIKENTPADQPSAAPLASMVVMLNWTEELEARMPSTK